MSETASPYIEYDPYNLLDSYGHQPITHMELCGSPPFGIMQRIPRTNFHLQTNHWSLRITTTDDTKYILLDPMSRGSEHMILSISVREHNTYLHEDEDEHVIKRVLITPVNLTVNSLISMITDNQYDKYKFVGIRESQNIRYWFKSVLERLKQTGKASVGVFEALSALTGAWEMQEKRVPTAQIAPPIRGDFYACDDENNPERSDSPRINGVNGY
ncbi:hypothetical protein ASPCADRAFT_10067 [Aspergillus carbonarius ITEM 5010]|uniref:DUF7770 domain-containing protein n=1 Tax=Aspergillus carbonarius (strain ITEM 5010) TaxID=602072 RepID=A0A1R3R8W8_ASPC5|nr:hypothetical protein ASPCADRAFT_10067 [Aspergillus carbonarius ITEM 5010]